VAVLLLQVAVLLLQVAGRAGAAPAPPCGPSPAHRHHDGVDVHSESSACSQGECITQCHKMVNATSTVRLALATAAIPGDQRCTHTAVLGCCVIQ
jgi:hypothetical protein